MAHAKFRETFWFKKGQLDARAADSPADAEPGVGDTLPIEDRYLDDGSVAAEDTASFGVHTGHTMGMTPMQRPAGRGDGMDEQQLAAEMKALPRTLLALLAAAGAAVGVVLMLAF